MPVVVTGTSGFLGRAVTSELAERGLVVTGVSRSTPDLTTAGDFDFRAVDLCEESAVRAVLAEVRPRALVHLATSFTSGADHREAEQLDYRMWRNLAAAATSVDRVVIASTELCRTDTAHLSAAQRVYVASKCRLERMALDFCQRTGTPALLYRLPHLAGATEQVRDKHDARILNRLLRSALGVDPDPVDIYVPASTPLRYLHVRTAAETVADRVAAPMTGFAIQECGTEAVTLTIAELVCLVGRVAGADPAVHWRHGRPGQPGRGSWRLSKAEQMVRDTVEWFSTDRPAVTGVRPARTA
jgi:nucleoside-diphosphate-sugar epimerase